MDLLKENSLLEEIDLVRKLYERFNTTYGNIIDMNRVNAAISSIQIVNNDKSNLPSIIKERLTSGADGIYWYGSKYWNKSYASEVLRRVIEYLLTEQDFYLVEANHRSSNPASGRVMEKAGMKYDGILRERRINSDGTRADTIYYSITKNEL